MSNGTKTITDEAHVHFSIRKYDDGSYDCVVNTVRAKDDDLTGYAQFFAKSFARTVQEFQKMMTVIDKDGTLSNNWPVKEK